MKKENTVYTGEIREILPNTMYKVALPDGRIVIGIPSGKMRRSFFRLLPGNRVSIEMTPYDTMRGRVTGKA
ncbi:translation initiation factor IF-1 [Candidatus Woesebacteria bacterium]|jgi:translation initiation factor IF-1|nr:translation initiation factor IF-1 [Candidatus Woesebacteria bacterium]MBP9687055.1 translation initiation factor IF-1 [Candidatus Woesebacteria bacterium]